MGNYFKTIYLFASMQIKRSFRDPLTVVILMGLPIILLVVFGAFLSNTNDISLRVAVINHSETEFAKDFEKTLSDAEILGLPDNPLTLDEAKDQMHQSELDTIIELPESFGQVNNQGMPSGAMKVYYDESDTQTGQIVSSVMSSIIDEYNKNIVGIDMPLSIEQTPINVNEAKPIAWVYAIFTGMALLMVGIFGVASSIPADKKAKILRRMHVTPLKASQVSIGTMLCFATIGIIMAIIMTAISMLAFGMEVRGDLATLILFIIFGLILMLGFGLAIGGVAKNSTQADVAGQIIFLVSLALGGVWIPIALMPEFLQNIVNFMPLTPVVEGIRLIVVDGASLFSLWSQLAVMAVWIVIVYVVGFKTFRWE